ncbi:hypothetical protein ACR79R_20190 [Sphingobacterium spiritivorum]|uniref:hypothetical protein n=1 Tax=Sphingobacterium spiritivorum TaxID=258 RepID=UPI003DA1F77B
MNPEDLNKLLEQDLLKSTPASIEEVKKEFIKLNPDQYFLDKCAIAAMQGILSAETDMRAIGGRYGNGTYNVKYLVEESYLIAKEMIKARKELNNE